MQSLADRQNLLDGYSGAGTSSTRTVAGCAVSLVLLAAVAGGALSQHPPDPRLLGMHAAWTGRLAVEQSGIAHARDIYAGRRAARQPQVHLITE
jgi:hypothetical protein